MTFLPIIPAFLIYIGFAAIVGFTIFCIINKKLRRTKIFRRIGIVALLLLAFARPVIANGSAQKVVDNLNLFIVVDNTGSMAAHDADGGESYRFEAVANDIKKIASTFSSSKISVITLDYNATLSVPLVNDVNTIYSYANSLRPKNTYKSSDSDLGAILDYATGRISQYNHRYPKRKSIVIFMSDGEDIKSETVFKSDELSKNISGGAIIGYGTKSGSTIGIVNNDGEIDENEVVRYDGKDIITKLNENNLQKIADKLKINYYEHDSSAEKFSDVNSFISTTTASDLGKEDTNSYEDLYWIAMLGAIGLLFWECYSILNALLLERKAVK